MSALLHDIGKLVLMHAYPGYPAQVHGGARTPEERIHRERRRARRRPRAGRRRARPPLGPAEPLATAIERHHADDADGEAAIVRLADMLAHYGHAQAGQPEGAAAGRARLRPRDRASCARSCTSCRTGNGSAKRNVDPCPLSSREVEVLKRLAEGKVYKQIAHELELSTSTVRTHLHNTYAQARRGATARRRC